MKKIIFAFSLLALISCGKKDKEYRSIANPNEPKSVIIEDAENAGGYSYLLVKEDDESYWIAVASDEFEKGETLYFSSFIEMKDFKSKELEKTFESILFVDQVSRDPGDLNPASQSSEQASPPRM